MIPDRILKNMDKWSKTIHSRAQLANDLERDPQHAIERVNAKLDEASRQEERRAAFLSARPVENRFDYETILYLAKEAS